MPALLTAAESDKLPVLSKVAPDKMPTVAEVEVPLKFSVPVATLSEEPFNAPVALTKPFVVTAPPVMVPATLEPLLSVVPPSEFRVAPNAKMPPLKIEVPVVVKMLLPLMVPELISEAIVSFAFTV